MYHPLIITLIAVISLTAVALYAVSIKRPAPVKPQDIIPKPTQIKIITPTAMFSTAVFLNRNKTFISLPYKLGDPAQTLWLTLQTPESVPPIIRLVSHPVIASLNWPYLEYNGLRLYQKSPQYQSVKDFIQNPPKNKTTLADPHLIKDPIFSAHKLQPLADAKEEVDLNNTDYILTTFTESRKDPHFSYYETTLDATPAFVSSEKKLNWQLAISSVSAENPMYLGDIHVDYRQF